MTKIQWTNKTWNPIIGCSKISPGCANCYAEKMAYRLSNMKPHRIYIHSTAMRRSMKQDVYYAYGKVVNNCGHAKHRRSWSGNTAFVESQLKKPLKTKKPAMFFVCSMGDLFHESVPFEWVDKVFSVIALCPQHTFQILTKRPERMLTYFTTVGLSDRIHKITNTQYGKEWVYSDSLKGPHLPLPNLWLGVTAENQEMADQRIPILLNTSSGKRFVSIYPMLGDIDLDDYLGEEGSICCNRGTEHRNRQCGCRFSGLDWVIVGCESLPGGKAGIGTFADEAAWWEAAYDLYKQCQEAGVAFFFKQGPVNGRVVKPDKQPELVPTWALTQEFPE